MSALRDLIKKRKEESAPGSAPASKYRRRGEVAAAASSEADDKKDQCRTEVQSMGGDDKGSSSANAGAEPITVSDGNSKPGDATPAQSLPAKEVMRRLRQMGQPITLFGEVCVMSFCLLFPTVCSCVAWPALTHLLPFSLPSPRGLPVQNACYCLMNILTKNRPMLSVRRA